MPFAVQCNPGVRRGGVRYTLDDEAVNVQHQRMKEEEWEEERRWLLARRLGQLDSGTGSLPVRSGLLAW